MSSFSHFTKPTLLVPMHHKPRSSNDLLLDDISISTNISSSYNISPSINNTNLLEIVSPSSYQPQIISNIPIKPSIFLQRVVILDKISSCCLFDRIWPSWKGEKTHNEKSDDACINFVRFESSSREKNIINSNTNVSHLRLNGATARLAKRSVNDSDAMEMIRCESKTLVCGLFYDKGLNRANLKNLADVLLIRFDELYRDKLLELKLRLAALSKSDPYAMAEETSIMKEFESFYEFTETNHDTLNWMATYCNRDDNIED